MELRTLQERLEVMDDMLKNIFKYSVLGSIGGIIYVLIELLYRGRSHWTMFLVAAIAFILIGLINEYVSWEMKLWKQMMIGTLISTVIEFAAGIVINLKLGWAVWDYSNVPLNIMGQICLPFCIIWFFISLAAIVADDYLRHWLFKEERPRYRL